MDGIPTNGDGTKCSAHQRSEERRTAYCSSMRMRACLAGSTLAATPTQADDRQITAADQAYFSYYHLDAARAKGYTGKGITIAIY